MTWPVHSPLIEKIEIKNNPKTRRNKLYYLREKSRREIRAKLKKVNLEQKANNNSEEAVNIDNNLESQNQE
jgi:large subunit ribosomal protein L19